MVNDFHTTSTERAHLKEGEWWALPMKHKEKGLVEATFTSLSAWLSLQLGTSGLASLLLQALFPLGAWGLTDKNRVLISQACSRMRKYQKRLQKHSVRGGLSCWELEAADIGS